MKKEFNIVLSGVGGQGIITLTKILAEAALIQGYDVKTSELHGLSQKGGSIESHVRFGGEVCSPLVRQGGANLIISLEAQEALKVCYYASQKSETVFLANDFIKPILNAKKTCVEEISKKLEKFSKECIFISASKIVKKELGKEVLAGVYLLGLAASKKLFPLKTKFILESIKRTVPEKYFLLNKKAFDLANYD